MPRLRRSIRGDVISWRAEAREGPGDARTITRPLTGLGSPRFFPPTRISPYARPRHHTLLLAVLGALTFCRRLRRRAGKRLKKRLPSRCPELPTVLHHDFRSGPLPDGLRIVNLHAKDHMQFRPDGLQVHVPNTYKIDPKAGLGVQTNFGLKGDFDSTLTFEDFQAETPPSGGGVHLGMYLRLLARQGRRATIACCPAWRQARHLVEMVLSPLSGEHGAALGNLGQTSAQAARLDLVFHVVAPRR